MSDVPRISLRSPRFFAFLLSQFLGAANDNAFKVTLLMCVLAAVPGTTEQVFYTGLASALFPLPFLIFSPLAGSLADRFRKDRVLVAAKLPEIVAMGLAVFGFAAGDIPFLMGVLFLMATQSAFFSPAKYGLLPEVVDDKDLSMANGLLQMTTNLAILSGSVAGVFVYSHNKEALHRAGLVYAAVAAVGWAAVLFVPRGASGNPRARFAWNVLSSFAADWAVARRLPALFHTILGIAYFGFLGSIVLAVVPVYGRSVLALPEEACGGLLAILSVGIGLGSVLAGKLSHRRVELGLVPLGAAGLSLFALDLALFGESGAARLPGGIPLRAACDLAGLGVAAGFFIVPLNALLQQRSPPGQKGRLIAFSNVLTFAAVLAAAALPWALARAGASPRETIGAAALVTLAATAFTLWLLPDFFVRLVLWLLTTAVYRIRVVGAQNIPTRGGLFVANHVSWVDAFLVGAASGRMVRFMMWRPLYQMRGLSWFFRAMHVIPVAPEDPPRKTQASLEQARREIAAGHTVCIFAEGSITRTGNLLKFRRGFERIVKDLDVPIVPVCLDGVWGSIFSYEGGRFLLKRPKRIPYPVTVLFGAPLPATATAFAVRQAVQDLSAAAARLRARDLRPLAVSFLRTARRRWRRPFVADAGSAPLSFGRALGAALALRDVLFGRGRAAEATETVGILLPPSVGGAIANLAVAAAGRIPVNLNYTASAEAFAHAVKTAGIRRILTSRRFLEKLGTVWPTGDAERLDLEDLLPRVSRTRAFLAAAACRLLPAPLAERLFLDGDRRDAGRTATILFSSGSTGLPKGVVLTHANVLSNIESLRQVFQLAPEDALLGVLPFFHSFGFTATLWLPAVAGLRAVYHANPLDARTVGRLAREHKTTILMATPTFLAAYLRRVEPTDFASLTRVVVGAEKLAEPIRRAFAEKYGVEPLEGYGCTECAPVVSVNIPDQAEGGRRRQVGNKPGSIGHPLPGISVRVVDPASRRPLPPGTEGLLLVAGPNVMKEYLGDPERTREALVEIADATVPATVGRWYVTGDIATLDEDGFLTITDRLARFAKVGGEMVPLGRIEEAILGAMEPKAEAPDPEAAIPGPPVCVTSVPDDKKGERIVVLYRKGALDPKTVLARLSDAGLPHLWMPRGDAFQEVEAIPLLGTGKVDLRAARKLAQGQ